MQVRSAFFLCACLVFGTAAATQTTTLVYRGKLLSGTTQSLLHGATAPDGGDLPLTTEPFAGRITGKVTVSGRPYSDDLNIVSFNFLLTGKDGARIGLYTGPDPLVYNGSNTFCGNGCIDFIALDGSFVGAALDLAFNSYHAPTSEFVISPAGDSVSYLEADTEGTCQNEGELETSTNPDGSVTYTGSTVNDCSIDASNTDPGRWSVMKAPELDGTFGLSALTLLLGSLAVFRGRKGISC